MTQNPAAMSKDPVRQSADEVPEQYYPKAAETDPRTHIDRAAVVEDLTSRAAEIIDMIRQIDTLGSIDAFAGSDLGENRSYIATSIAQFRNAFIGRGGQLSVQQIERVADEMIAGLDIIHTHELETLAQGVVAEAQESEREIVLWVNRKDIQEGDFDPQNPYSSSSNVFMAKLVQKYAGDKTQVRVVSDINQLNGYNGTIYYVDDSMFTGHQAGTNVRGLMMALTEMGSHAQVQLRVARATDGALESVARSASFEPAIQFGAYAQQGIRMASEILEGLPLARCFLAAEKLSHMGMIRPEDCARQARDYPTSGLTISAFKIPDQFSVDRAIVRGYHADQKVRYPPVY